MRLRTSILSAALILAVIGGGLLYVALGDQDDRRAGAITSTYTASGTWQAQIGGISAGTVKNLKGCVLTADVASQGADKVVGPTKYEPCVLEVGPAIGKPLADWIAAALAGKQAPADVVLTQFDPATGKGVVSLLLQKALLSKFSLPTLDAGSGAQGFFKLTFVPQSIVKKDPTGETLGAKSQKAWLVSSFAVTIGGSQVNVAAVESWSAEFPAGAPPRLDDVVVWIAESQSATLDAMFDNTLARGAAKEYAGKLDLRSTDGAKSLFTLTLSGMGMNSGQFHGSVDGGASRKHFSFYLEGAAITFAPDILLG